MIGNTVVVSRGARGSIARAAVRDNIRYMAYDLDTCNTMLYIIHVRPHHTAYTLAYGFPFLLFLTSYTSCIPHISLAQGPWICRFVPGGAHWQSILTQCHTEILSLFLRSISGPGI